LLDALENGERLIANQSAPLANFKGESW